MKQNSFNKELATNIFGIITTIIAIAICSWVEINWNFSIYSWMFIFILPVGAVCAGFVAASGYYFSAQIFHLPSSSKLTTNIVVTSIAAFFLIHYISYFFYELDGILIRERIDFLPYLDILLTGTSYTFLRSQINTGEVGSWGYVIAFIQFLGFTSAGIAVSQMLKEKPYCKDCSKYYSEKYNNSVFSSDGEKFLKDYIKLATLLKFGSLKKIGSSQIKIGSESSDNHHLLINFCIFQCSCKTKNNYLKLSMKKLKGDDWETIENLSAVKVTKEKIQLKY